MAAVHIHNSTGYL